MIIKSFKLFESNKEIDSLCHNYYIEDYTITEGGYVDVNGGVLIYSENLSKIPLKFGNVSGNFLCDENVLESLENSPKSIGGDFDCSHNNLTSLRNGPKSVGGDFYCNKNKLTSFEGLAEYIGRTLYCDDNPVYEIYRLNPCEEFAEMMNEYDVIRDENKVVETRLRQALEDSGYENIPEFFIFNNYQLV